MGTRRQAGLTRAIASEAARLIAQGHCQDHHAACRKAAERLGERNPRHWPDAGAIDDALREYQALFQRDSQPQELLQLRRLALQAMHDLDGFAPRLIGPVARGVANRHQRIQLLLRADTPEQVALALTDRHIPWRAGETMLDFSRNRRAARPTLSFQAGDSGVELIVLDPADRHDPPRDPLGDGPLKGLSAQDLAQLLGPP